MLQKVENLLHLERRQLAEKLESPQRLDLQGYLTDLGTAQDCCEIFPVQGPYATKCIGTASCYSNCVAHQGQLTKTSPLLKIDEASVDRKARLSV